MAKKIESQKRLDALLRRKYSKWITTKDALSYLAELVNLSGTLGNKTGIAHALSWSDDLFARKLTGKQTIILHYFTGNAWAHRSKRKDDQNLLWAWEHQALQKEIVHLRSAIQHPNFSKHNEVMKCQIFTNLAGALSRIGRFIEANKAWAEALKINPNFGMARGNLGIGQYKYAEHLYEKHAVDLFLQSASENLAFSLGPKAEYESNYDDAKKIFKWYLDQITPWLSKRNIHDKPLPRRKRSEAEISYRLWCHEQQLCLNPLNELDKCPKILIDDLLLPDFSTLEGQTPNFLKFFNQLKQEFISARWFLYEGLESENVHFGDRDAPLYNTLDYSSFGIGIEQIKTAFRMSYSLLDKIAFFLNSYFKLGHNTDVIYFRNVWRENPSNRKNLNLHSVFLRSKNAPLRGLYWLSKDIHDGVNSTMEPEARELSIIRNHLEHKSFQIIQFGPLPTKEPGMYSIGRPEFERMTIKVMQTARSALIYLLLAMNQEEAQREKASDKTGRSVSMPLYILEDERKRPF